MVQPSRAASFLVLVLAGGSDVLDGWYARRFHQATPTGAVLDPVTDKLFALSVVVTLVATKALPLLSVLLLTTREIGELPLLFWFLVSSRAWRARATEAAANVPGKIATSLQFASIVAALMRASYTDALLFATAGAGAVAAVAYWIREIGAVRAAT
jgi:CDP-diacylglycerol--glycerol-3-phosphate 3-phosphatidyltransferase/cardiolipin synthase